MANWKGKEDPSHNYYHLFNHDGFLGGILPLAFRNPGAPPHWQIYLLLSDCDEVATKAKCLGAKLYMPPRKIEDIGRMAVMADPQGAAFALFEAARQQQELSFGQRRTVHTSDLRVSGQFSSLQTAEPNRQRPGSVEPAQASPSDTQLRVPRSCLTRPAPSATGVC